MKTNVLVRLVGEFEFRCAQLVLYVVLSVYAGWVCTPSFPFGFWQGLVVLLALAALAPMFVVACCVAQSGRNRRQGKQR